MERLILLLLFFSMGVLRADMLPTELRFTLKQVPTRSDQHTVLELEIKNTSALHNSILVAGHPQLGMGLFEVLAYERAESMKWTLDTTYSLVLPDSAAVDKKYMQFWSLDPGESFKQLFVINEPPSSGRAYQIKYQPHVCEDFFKYAFRWYDGEGEPTDAAIDGDQRFAYQGPMFSDLCDIFYTINDAQLKDRKAKNFYQANWKRVKHQVKRSMKYPQTWPVLSAQLYSQAVLSSLPTYSHQYLILETKNGIAYLSLGYQIGKIRPIRSFLAKIAHLCGARRVFWRTSSSKAIKLTYFQITPFQ
ncbi:MAG: hypothetical protein K9J18_07315 [Crocinitomicaceae bacterium]|nr:hypothetical protein [Crocinitomicaceae bacterium]